MSKCFTKWGSVPLPHFKDVEAKAQNGEVTCQPSPCKLAVEAGIEQWSPKSWTQSTALSTKQCCFKGISQLLQQFWRGGGLKF